MTGMSRTLFFFGAGLSSACGVPDSRAMSNEFKQQMNSRGQMELLRIFQNMEGRFPARESDMERIYTLITDRKDHNYFKNRSNSIYDDIYLDLFYDFNKEMEFDVLQKEIESFLYRKSWIMNFNYGPLAGILPVEFIRSNINDITLSTTNYDLLIENHFSHMGIHNLLNTGLDREGFLDVSYLGKPLMIDYLKLHGSVNLYQDSKGRVRHSPGPVVNGTITEFGDIVKGVHLTHPLDGINNYDSHEACSNLLFMFEERMDRCEYLILIGTSMRDTSITDIIRDHAEKKKVIAVGNRMKYLKAIPELMSNESVIFHDGYIPDEECDDIFELFRRANRDEIGMDRLMEMADHSPSDDPGE